MNKSYLKLKGRVKELGYTQRDISKKIGKSSTYVAERMRAKEDRYFTENDIYKILSLIKEPYENMGLYFNEKQRQGRRWSWKKINIKSVLQERR